MASALPPLYRGWIEELAGGPVDGEPRATCERCAMVAHPGDPPKEHTFLASTKCCTYQPDLANFAVGRVLFDDHPLGARSREVLRQRIAARVGVTPLGVAPAPVYAALFASAAASQTTTSVFGRAPLLRCPHFLEREGGLCGIWRHREAQCTTWFCKLERGALGRLHWRVLQNLLHTIESSLRVWAAARAGITDDALAELWGAEQARVPGKVTLDEGQLNNVVPEATWRRLWGRYVDREAELYNLTAAWVSSLALADVLRIGGTAEQSAANAYRVLAARLRDPALPPRVTVGGGAVYRIGPPGRLRARVREVPYDALELPDELVRALGRFEGADPRAVAAELGVDERLLRALLDWGLLSASPSSR
jgi:hypothetical protein